VERGDEYQDQYGEKKLQGGAQPERSLGSATGLSDVCDFHLV
jgi:hypothetical protein